MRTTWLVAYDFSPHARAALRVAVRRLTALGGGHLLVVHALPYLTSGLDVAAGLSAGGLELEVLREQAAMELALEVGAVATGDQVTSETRVEIGSPADVVAELVVSEGVSEVVVGSHGRTGFEHFILGSVAERIVQSCACTVLVVKLGDADVQEGKMTDADR